MKKDMKKIVSYMLMTALAAFAMSCQGLNESEQGSGSTEPSMKGVFYADIPGEKAVVEIAPGASKTYTLKACAFQSQVTDIVINFSFKADPDAVATYNQAHSASYEMCPGSAFEFLSNEVMIPRYGKTSTTAKLRVSSSGLEQGKTYILPIALDKAKQTENWAPADTLAAYVLLKASNYDPNGPGTENNPYSISSVEDLKGMDAKMVEGSMVYFRLEKDIDMSGVTDWKPLNPVPYKPFSLDGAGHTISNFTAASGLFDTAVGKIFDLTVKDAKITLDTSIPIGILGSYGGSEGLPVEVKNVFVSGKIVNEKSNGTGGLFGIIAEATIDACSADVTLATNKYDVGGIYGYDNSVAGKKSVISNCWTTGNIYGNRMVGGIAGMLSYKETECAIINCYSTAEVHAQFKYGGIVGDAMMGLKTDNANKNPMNRIEKCIAWNKAIYSDVADNSVHYSSGAIVGFTALKNYHVDCYRKYDLSFSDCPGNSSNVLVDQANSSPDNPLVEVAVSDGATNYNFPYHGKAAAEGATASKVAKDLGWSESVWDLSGDLPFFKGGNAPVIISDDNANGQLPDFGENEFYK